MMRRSLPDVSALPEVHYPHFSHPWFSYVPKDGDESTHPEWFGASWSNGSEAQLRRRRSVSIRFSHVPFAQRGMTEERAIAEYRYCSQIANELGIPETTFIFPRNLVAYLPEFEECRIQVFSRHDKPLVRLPSHALSSVAAVCADFLGLYPPMVEPSLKEELFPSPARF